MGSSRGAPAPLEQDYGPAASAQLVVTLHPADCTQLEQVDAHWLMHMVSVRVQFVRHDPPKQWDTHCCSCETHPIPQFCA